MRTLLLLGLCALTGSSLLGCDTNEGFDFDLDDAFAYTAYGEDGDVVATGTLRIESIPADEAGEPSRLEGDWTIDAVSDEAGPQDGTGTLAGSLEDTVEGPTFSIDLHPALSDDGVVLTGRMLDDGDRLDGTWQHLGFAGPLASGAFEAVRR